MGPERGCLRVDRGKMLKKCDDYSSIGHMKQRIEVAAGGGRGQGMMSPECDARR